MRILITLLTITIITFIFIDTYKIKEDYLKPILLNDIVYKNEKDFPVNDFLNEVLNTNFLFKQLSIKRKNYSIINVEENFVIDFEINKPLFDYETVKAKSDVIFNSNNIFSKFTINYKDIWKNKNELLPLFPEKIIFSGYMEVNSKKTGYVYFFNQLINVQEGDTLGENEILKIFKDGILLFNKNKEFRVIK